MNWMDGFNNVVQYIETHLEDEMDYDKMAGILGYSTYHFQRLFLLVAGISLAEYIRSRRLSKAAAELMDADSRVLDVALKYGYSSPNSFHRAFKAMHGMPPGDVKKGTGTIKAFPPLSFELTVKGASSMEYRVEKMASFRIVGRKLSTTIENGECYQRIPAFWGEMMQSGGPGEILAQMDQKPFGLLGVSDYDPQAPTSAFSYFIAVSSAQPVPDGMEELTVPALTWAVFPQENDNPANLQDYQKRIVLEWLPSSGYEFAKGPDVELYYDDGRMETRVPVRKISGGTMG